MSFPETLPFTIYPFDTREGRARGIRFFNEFFAGGHISPPELHKVQRGFLQMEYTLGWICRLTERTFPHEFSRAAFIIGACTHLYDKIFDTPDPGVATEAAIELTYKLFEPQQQFQATGRLPWRNNIAAEVFLSLELAAEYIPPHMFPHFWQCLKALHIAQTLSLLQRTDIGFRPTNQELRTISDVKGGLSGLLITSVAIPEVALAIPSLQLPNAPLTLENLYLAFRHPRSLFVQGRSPFADAVYLGGETMQIIDDYKDREEDKAHGIETEMTRVPLPLSLTLRRVLGNMRRVEALLLQSGVNKEVLKAARALTLKYVGLNIHQAVQLITR